MVSQKTYVPFFLTGVLFLIISGVSWPARAGTETPCASVSAKSNSSACTDTQLSSQNKKRNSGSQANFTTGSSGSFTTGSSGPFTATGALNPATPIHQKQENWKHDHHRSYFYRDHGSYGHPDIVTTVVLPEGYTSVPFKGQTYYYGKGAFYQLHGQTLVPVSAPVGAVVQDIPFASTRVDIGHNSYQTHKGIYYKHTSDGYEVVQPPDEVKTHKTKD